MQTMNEKVQYIKPPTPPRRRSEKPKSASKQISDFLFRNRMQFAPMGVVLMLAIVAKLIGSVDEFINLIVFGCIIGYGWIMYQEREYRVPLGRLDRVPEHRYAAVCAGVAGLWYLIATWGTNRPSAHAIVELLILGAMCSVPWWSHHAVRGSVPVRFQGAALARGNRTALLAEAKGLVFSWSGFCTSAHIQGATLKSITFDGWSVVLRVKLRQGQSVRRLNTASYLADLDTSSPWAVSPGASRVTSVEKDARLADIRFMLADPHENPIYPPLHEEVAPDRMIIGLFETGAEVLFQLANTLIAGATDAGKSGVVNAIIRVLARMPNVAIVGIDMKPGAPELSPWADVMAKLATTPQEAADLLQHIFEGMTYRGNYMSSQGKRVWDINWGPYIVLIVEEMQLIKRCGLGKRLDDIVALIRASGGCVIGATQYPTNANVSQTFKQQCKQRIGLYVEDGTASRVIFGQNAERLGWTPHMISMARQGSFFIKNKFYAKPLLARAFLIDDELVQQEAERYAPLRVEIDEPTWNAVLTEHASTERLELEESSTPEDDIQDAVIVDPDDPAERILEALRRGCETVPDLMRDTGFSRATVNRHLQPLINAGIVSRVKRGHYGLK